MSQILSIDLYHGTSSLFLDSIMNTGLGATNPVEEWNLIPLSREIYQLSETHLKDSKIFQVSGMSFKRMTEQANSGSFNWQHGQTYLSPALSTAARYAINKPYGSELLSYIFKFLNELLRLDLKDVNRDLFSRYPKVFGLLEARPSPILIKATNISIADLTDEHGNDCTANLRLIKEVEGMEVNVQEMYLQQCNFRLTSPVPNANLTAWMINVQKFDSLSPIYNLYKLLKK